MKSIKYLIAILMMFVFNMIHAQYKNAKTITVRVDGNCEMCKSAIQKAGSIKNEANVIWDKNSKMATITFDDKKTKSDEILKRIALAGYDNEQYFAPDAAYAQLPKCCQYDRSIKPMRKHVDSNELNLGTGSLNDLNQFSTNKPSKNELKSVFENYFKIKNELVLSDANAVINNAQAFSKSLKDVAMDNLSHEAHTIWMDVITELNTQADKIASSKDIAKQRAAFALLSIPMYKLAKVTIADTPIYYQHCSMYNNGKGGTWLSEESEIKNPFYGTQMLTCGSIQDTIK